MYFRGDQLPVLVGGTTKAGRGRLAAGSTPRHGTPRRRLFNPKRIKTKIKRHVSYPGELSQSERQHVVRFRAREED